MKTRLKTFITLALFATLAAPALAQKSPDAAPVAPLAPLAIDGGSGPGNGGHPERIRKQADTSARVVSEFMTAAQGVLEDFDQWAYAELPEVSVAGLDAAYARISSGEIRLVPTTSDLRDDRGQICVAVNHPVEKVIEIQVDRWTQSAKTPAARKSLALHELSPMGAIEDAQVVADEIRSSVVSSRYERLLLTRPASKPVPSTAPATAPRATRRDTVKRASVSLTPVLLYRTSAGETRDGMSFDAAVRLCNNYRGLFLERYYFVYCRFAGKEWQDIRQETRTYTDYRFMGYTTQSGSSSSSLYLSSAQSSSFEASRRNRRGARTIGASQSSEDASQSSESSEYYSQEPVVESVEVPYLHTSNETVTVYGLEVYGMASLSASLPWKTLIQSDSIAPGIPEVTYATSKEALVDCYKSLVFGEAGSSAAFARSKCVARKKGDRWAYDVVTQNPFIR